ncbi:hypothetical protein LguiB_020750 [Lonicera macranthoides]
MFDCRIFFPWPIEESGFIVDANLSIGPRKCEFFLDPIPTSSSSPSSIMFTSSLISESCFLFSIFLIFDLFKSFRHFSLSSLVDLGHLDTFPLTCAMCCLILYNPPLISFPHSLHFTLSLLARLINVP